MTRRRSEAAGRLPGRLPLRRRRDGPAAAVRHAVGQPGARALRRPALQRLPRRDDDAPPGAARNGIDKVGAGIVSRGVLLDLARAAGRARAWRRAPRSRPPTSRPPSARRACASRAATCCSCAPATSACSRVDGDRVGYMRMMPGLGMACAEWLHAPRGRRRRHRHQLGRGDPLRGSEDPAAAAPALPARHGPDARRDVRPRRPGRRLRRRRRVGVPLHRPAAARSPAASARRSIRWR